MISNLTDMGCTPSILSSDSEHNRKDSGLFCVNIGRTSLTDQANNSNDHNDVHQNSTCQQSLLSPYQKEADADADKTTYMKKDSIVSVAGLGHLTGFSAVQTVVRRATNSATTSTSARLGHRKSSLALTPEEEPLDIHASKPSHEIKYPNLLPPNPSLRVLLVFHKNDLVCEAMVNACHRLQMESTVSKTMDSAFDAFQNPISGGHHIVIVDGRQPKTIDPETVGRTLRNTKGSHYTTMVVVTKRNTFDKDDTAVLALLDAGYNRCMAESPHASFCLSELRQIQHSLVRPQNVISTQQALYTALHRLKEATVITDDLLRIQYANRAAERLFNIKMDEIVCRPLAELFSSDVELILTQTQRCREFDSLMSIKRKSLDITNVHVHVVPVACIGRTPTHLVITLDPSGQTNDVIAQLPQPKEAPRGSLHSIRRGSFDVRSIASDGLRRTSLAKLSALPLEAPITKVVSILGQVQESCSPDEAKLLDRVMEFLKREGLYSPQMKEMMRPDDPVATDLIGALLTQGPTNTMSSRRSSNDSVIRSSNRQSSISTLLPLKAKGAQQITDLLQTSLDWDFDIFKLEELTDKRPLVSLGMELFRRFEVFQTLSIDETTCNRWFIVMEAHYHAANTYHNSTHAADVMQATAAFLHQLAMKDNKTMDNMDEATALISASAHDVDHPGRSSAFLCNSNNYLAILYNDLCVLESHHAALTFKLTLRDEKVNIFKNLDRENYKHVRSIIVDMILATEMTRHFEHLAKFVSIFGTDNEMTQSESDDNQVLIRRMLIKCADVSNPARPLPFCVEWARRIAEEYFTQTDEEKRHNLPIVMPMFDRATCSISKSQIGFIEYIIQDMLQAWDGFIDMPELIHYMQYNYAQWKAYEEQGINTLNDIKAKQLSISSQGQNPQSRSSSGK